MVVNLCRGTDHSAIKEYIECCRLKILLSKQARPVIFPQNGKQKRGDNCIYVP
jgi:hypothetical protein